jgi:uncharacterized protein (DUF433 family)
MRYEDHFESRSDLHDGKPVIKGTDVLVRDVMQVLARGASVKEVLLQFPDLTERDVRAVIAFAALAAD